MSIRDLVVNKGDRVRVQGTLVQDDDGDWLDVRRVIPLSFRPGPPRHRPNDLRLVGFDPDARPPPGPDQIPNRVAVVGVWTDRCLEVEVWDRSTWGTPRLTGSGTVPCSEPKGGWPADDDGYSVGLLIAQLARARLGAFHVVRVRPDSLVVVLATDKPAAVEAAVDPALRRRLCVIPSRYPPGAEAAARARLDERFWDWGIESMRRPTENGRTVMDVALFRVTPDIAAWTEAQPPGLIRWSPTLVPVAG